MPPISQQLRQRFAPLAWLALTVCCATGRREQEAEERTPAEWPSIVINFSDRQQTISGFGASSAWTAPTLSATLADQFFSTESGIGLSLLRIQIKPDGETTELATAEQAAARGVRVWAAPWSPPSEWKDNQSTTHGGRLLEEHYDDWAASLADFAQAMVAASVPLFMLSVQNEPDYIAEWDTCEWTPEELAQFIGGHLGPALTARNLSTPLLAPETANWNSFQRYADAIVNDEAASTFVEAFATHAYAGDPFVFEAGSAQNKQLWETEVSDPGAAETGSTADIDSALRVAHSIHEHLTEANVSAWHYWWLLPRGDTADNNSALADKAGDLTLRAYALGNYSRFVRPGFARVASTQTLAQGVYASAYLEAESGRLAIVAVNELNYAIEQRFEWQGGSVSELVPWVTSVEHRLQAGEPLPRSDADFVVTLEPRSVTTFVGLLRTSPRDGGG